MRKLLVGFVFLALCFAFSGVSAHAQTVITLNGGTCNSCFNFAVAGTVTTLNQSSVVLGTAGSSGPLSPGTIPSSLKFALVESSPITFAYASHGLYNYSSGNPIIVQLSGGSFNLAGILSVQTLNEVGSFGFINDNITGNFSIVSSTCLPLTACAAPGTAYGNVLLSLSSAAEPIKNKTKAGFSSGNIYIPTPLVTPEPTSLLLFGSGLLALGGVLRRRLLVSA